ncbi:hypothetical protein D3C80_1300870 [compost metagenome]
MAEDIDVERLCRQALQRLNLASPFNRIDGGDGDGAQRPCVRHGGRQLRRRGPGHGRLNDGQVQSETVGEGGLHARFLPFRRRRSTDRRGSSPRQPRATLDFDVQITDSKSHDHPHPDA